MRRQETGVQEWPPGSGRYRIDYYTQDGKRHREVIGPKKLAMEVYRARKAAIFERRYQPAAPVTRMTFSELARLALESKRGRIAPLSFASDTQRTREIEDILGSALIDKIGPLDIDRVLSKIQNQRTASRQKGGKRKGLPLSGSTVNRYRAALSSTFTYAIKTKLLAENPVREIEKYNEPDGRERYLDPNEEVALRLVIREYCPEREVELDLALHTGMRRGEQFDLRWQDVDLARRIITAGGGPYGKTGRHHIDLNSVAIRAFEQLYARSAGSAKVIQATAYWSWPTEWLDDCVRAADIEDFHWHDLRHTFASRAIMRGVNLRTLQRWLGHKSIKTTERYLHMAPSHTQSEIEKLVDTPEDTQKTKIS